MNCLPDTGCTQSVISADLATAIGATVDTTAQVNLLTANGGNITVLGQAQLYMQLRDKTTTTFVIVAQNVSHSALISWHDLQQLGVIPKTFPQVNACSSAASDALKAKTVSKFMNVFRDALTDEPMSGTPVHIHLKENSRPFRISVARQIPLRFREPADKAIQQLLDNKVIARCDEPTDWCSPGFFVVKSDGKSVRLVTDYTKLNSFVDRPVHPFPSVSEILKTIPASAKVFAKFDAVNGYFSIPQRRKFKTHYIYSALRSL